MIRYILRRLITSLVIIFIVVSLSFFMVRLMPGNPMAALESQLRMQGGLSEEDIRMKVQALYGVTPDEPIGTAYLKYIANVAHGDLGRPITNPSTTVVAVINEALPWTILIVASALFISFIIGIAIGAAMAANQTSWVTKVVSFIVSLLSAVPSYLVAIWLLWWMTADHHWFPSGGAYSIDVTPGPNWPYISSVLYHAVLPTAASVITAFGGWALGMKGSAVSVLGTEYVRAAESRGLGPRRVARSYIGRNSMLPMITQLALSVGFMFGGSVFIETYFQYPGIGFYLVQSVSQRDYTLMMGCFLLITVSVVITNFLVDILYPLIDPRIAKPGARSRVAGDVEEDPSKDVLPAGGTVA